MSNEQQHLDAIAAARLRVAELAAERSRAMRAATLARTKEGVALQRLQDAEVGIDIAEDREALRRAKAFRESALDSHRLALKATARYEAELLTESKAVVEAEAALTAAVDAYLAARRPHVIERFMKAIEGLRADAEELLASIPSEIQRPPGVASGLPILGQQILEAFRRPGDELHTPLNARDSVVNQSRLTFEARRRQLITGTVEAA